MQHFETTNIELRPGMSVHLDIEATFESQDTYNYTFRLANGIRVTLPRQQRLNDLVMWQGQKA